MPEQDSTTRPAFKTCNANDCDRKAIARDLCALHYQRWQHANYPFTDSRIKHGMWGTKAYYTWSAMKSRCLNPKSYPKYGGRGITICDRWLKFENFLIDMGHPPSDDLSLDRIDNDGPYSPENCRWATRSEQGNNNSRNVTFEIGGQRYTATQWEPLSGIPRRVIYSRLANGWDKEKAFLTPFSKRVKRNTHPAVDVTP